MCTVTYVNACTFSHVVCAWVQCGIFIHMIFKAIKRAALDIFKYNIPVSILHIYKKIRMWGPPWRGGCPCQAVIHQYAKSKTLKDIKDITIIIEVFKYRSLLCEASISTDSGRTEELVCLNQFSAEREVLNRSGGGIDCCVCLPVSVGGCIWGYCTAGSLLHR